MVGAGGAEKARELSRSAAAPSAKRSRRRLLSNTEPNQVGRT